MKRRPDWKQRLVNYVNESSNQPYKYGVMDCWCFSRGCVFVQTDVLLLPHIRPDSWLAAAKVLLKNGWATVEDVMITALGEPVDVLQTSMGDVVTTEVEGLIHLAIRMNGNVALSASKNGLIVHNPEEWRKGWRI